MNLVRPPLWFEVAKTVVKYCDIEGNAMEPDIAVKKIILKYDCDNNYIGSTVTVNHAGFSGVSECDTP